MEQAHRIALLIMVLLLVNSVAEVNAQATIEKPQNSSDDNMTARTILLDLIMINTGRISAANINSISRGKFIFPRCITYNLYGYST